MRIYIYNEGLARFSTNQYSYCKNLANNYENLTNYSLNKKNDKFIQNTVILILLECKLSR